MTWSSGAEGRSTAISLVHWATPAERIPYGLEDTKVAYEYVFNFQEDGYMLEGGVPNSKSNVEVYFVLPNDASYTYQPVIYGRVNYDDVWKYGILKANGSDNKIFTLNSIDVTKDIPYVQEVTAQFDNNAFEAVNEVRVSTTEDLMKYLKGFESSYGHQYNFNFDVHVYGTDLAITDEVVEYLDEIAKDMDVELNGIHNYFRYDVLDERTAAELDKSLAARISAENYTLEGGWSDCRIFVRWMTGRTTATEFYGVPESNITHIDINTDLNFKSNKWYPETGFKTLADVNWAKGYWAEGNDYTPAMIINATVQVDNNATFVVEEGVGSPWNGGDKDVLADKLNVQVNGKFKVNNSSKVLNENVSVSGKGEVEIDSKNIEFEWTNWNVEKWTGK